VGDPGVALAYPRYRAVRTRPIASIADAWEPVGSRSVGPGHRNGLWLEPSPPVIHRRLPPWRGICFAMRVNLALGDREILHRGFRDPAPSPCQINAQPQR
jgi:hypothetical protein